MSKNIIIVSKCQHIVPYSETENTYFFHFKGVFAGDMLTEIILRGRMEFNIEQDLEYLLYVKMDTITNGTMVGSILRLKPLDECWDKEAT